MDSGPARCFSAVDHELELAPRLRFRILNWSGTFRGLQILWLKPRADSISSKLHIFTQHFKHLAGYATFPYRGHGTVEPPVHQDQTDDNSQQLYRMVGAFSVEVLPQGR